LVQGVNFPKLSVLIRADASNSCIADTQWPGRAARKQENKEVSLVFDFTDEYSPQFHRKAVELQVEPELVRHQCSDEICEPFRAVRNEVRRLIHQIEQNKRNNDGNG